jgi:heat shock protein HslJ
MTKIIPLLVLTLLINSCCTKKNINKEESTTNQDKMVLNGNWKISRLIGLDKLSKSPTLTIDFDAKKISGNAGCNSYGTDFSIEEDQIKFGIPVATKMMCTNMKVEKAFFNCLQNTSQYKLVDGELKFYDKDGEEQMVCAKIEE